VLRCRLAFLKELLAALSICGRTKIELVAGGENRLGAEASLHTDAFAGPVFHIAANDPTSGRRSLRTAAFVRRAWSSPVIARIER